jgi:hypothetical protein
MKFDKSDEHLIAKLTMERDIIKDNIKSNQYLESCKILTNEYRTHLVHLK